MSDIETEIFEAISATNDEKAETKKFVKGSSKKTKNELIHDYLKMCGTDSEKEEQVTEASLKKLTKPEILKLIAEKANKVFEPTPETISTTTAEKTRDTIEQNSVKQVDPIAMRFDLIANGMFNLNLALLGCLETGSHLLKEKTGDIILLENLTKNTAEKKEAFVVIFKQIYREYQEQLDIYLSPMSQYAILTTQVLTETVFKNVANKKKKLPEQNSTLK